MEGGWGGGLLVRREWGGEVDCGRRGEVKRGRGGVRWVGGDGEGGGEEEEGGGVVAEGVGGWVRRRGGDGERVVGLVVGGWVGVGNGCGLFWSRWSKGLLVYKSVFRNRGRCDGSTTVSGAFLCTHRVVVMYFNYKIWGMSRMALFRPYRLLSSLLI